MARGWGGWGGWGGAMEQTSLAAVFETMSTRRNEIGIRFRIDFLSLARRHVPFPCINQPAGRSTVSPPVLGSARRLCRDWGITNTTLEDAFIKIASATTETGAAALPQSMSNV